MPTPFCTFCTVNKVPYLEDKVTVIKDLLSFIHSFIKYYSVPIDAEDTDPSLYLPGAHIQ